MPCDFAMPRKLPFNFVRHSSTASRARNNVRCCSVSSLRGGDGIQQGRVGATELGQPIGVVAVVLRIGLADQAQLRRVGDEHVVGEGGQAAANPVAVGAGFRSRCAAWANGGTSDPRPPGGGDLAFLEAFAIEVGEPHEATFIADVDAGNGRDFVVFLHLDALLF